MSDEKYQDELADLEYTKSVRKRIVTKLTEKDIPGDTDELRILLTTLTDLDRAALGKMKIKSDDKNGAANANAQAVVAALLMKVDPSKVALMGRTERPIPTLGNDVEKPSIIEGEIAIGTQTGTYEDFASKNFTNQ